MVYRRDEDVQISREPNLTKREKTHFRGQLHIRGRIRIRVSIRERLQILYWHVALGAFANGRGRLCNGSCRLAERVRHRLHHGDQSLTKPGAQGRPLDRGARVELRGTATSAVARAVGARVRPPPWGHTGGPTF